MAVKEESFGSYKDFHENFMLNHNGTSLLETSILTTPAPAILLLWSVVLPAIRCHFGKRFDSIGTFMAEFIILILPIVFTYTIFSDYIPFVTTLLLLAWATFAISSIGWHGARKRSESWLEIAVAGNRRPFITLFRSCTNVITCLCILAVDFRVFPRKFAKTEVSGYGFMDTGTGLFVVANALVSYKHRDVKGGFSIMREFKSSVPLLVLGLVRCFALRLLNYQTHVSEYGTHWNFFLTLAVTRVLGAALSSAFWSGSSWSVGMQFVVLALAHEAVLSALGWREWVISEDIPRLSFVSANREGLVSLLGYLALHSAGSLISTRTWGVPRHKVGHWLTLWLELTFGSLIAWGATRIVQDFTGVSRRVADLGYICWILAYALTNLAFFLGVELTISLVRYYGSTPPKSDDGRGDGEMKEMSKEDGVVEHQSAFVPVLLQAVNHNGLEYFLLGNVMTGVVNLSLQTLHVETSLSIIVLTLYMLILCALTNILYLKEIKFKL